MLVEKNKTKVRVVSWDTYIKPKYTSNGRLCLIRSTTLLIRYTVYIYSFRSQNLCCLKLLNIKGIQEGFQVTVGEGLLPW